jgi:hypothetical protein
MCKQVRNSWLAKRKNRAALHQIVNSFDLLSVSVQNSSPAGGASWRFWMIVQIFEEPG